MTDILMTTKELAAYINLNEKKIYDLVKKGTIPNTKVTGKYLFPRDSIDKWIEDSIVGASTGKGCQTVTITGSHDPAIDQLVAEVNTRYTDMTMLTASVGSTKGMEMLSSGGADMAGIHILDPETSDYNLPWLEKHSPRLKPVVVHFTMRSQGLIVAKGNPLGISGIEDLCTLGRKGVEAGGLRFINRQAGSGTRLLFDHMVAVAELDPSSIDFSAGEVATHTEVAQSVRTGRSDAGIGAMSAALAAGLDFVPLAEESFDIAVSKRNFYSESVQKCLEVIRSQDFRDIVAGMGGYDMKNSGKVISWG